jgi:hypothetical protein
MPSSTLLMQVSITWFDIPRLLELELGIKLKGIEVSLSSCKFSYLDYTNEDEPRGLILPLQEKKKRNLKFTRFLKGAMVIVKTCNQTRHGRHQICSVFFQGMKLRKLAWQLTNYLQFGNCFLLLGTNYTLITYMILPRT